MKKKLLIFPLGGNGLEALDCLTDEYELLGFIDDNLEKQGLHPLGFEVFSRNAIDDFPDSYLLAVQGSPNSFQNREDVLNTFNISKTRWAKIIHPSASISNYAQIGYNILIMAGTVITHNVKIGNHICILPNTVIHHDSQIDNYCMIGSSVVIAGHSKINKNCYIGSKSSIINNITIGQKTLVGIGTNVIQDIAPNSKIVGNPSRSL